MADHEIAGELKEITDLGKCTGCGHVFIAFDKVNLKITEGREEYRLCEDCASIKGKPGRYPFQHPLPANAYSHYAFPFEGNPGATLRDLAAFHALPGILAKQIIITSNPEEIADQVAGAAYKIADAMMKRRGQP